MDAATQLAPVEAQVEVMLGLVAGLDPDGVPLPEAPAMWRAFDAIARAAGAAQVLLARRVEESSVWASQGSRSAAEYLGRVSGTSVRSAREALRASKDLANLPLVEQALRRGDLSVTQAELITGAAGADPTRQAQLVESASRLSLAELAQECGRVKAAADPDPDATYRRLRADRRLRQHTGSDGAWCLSGRGTPDDGALFRFALEPLIDEIFDDARREGRHEHRDVYAYDAFVELLRRSLDIEDGPSADDEGGSAHASTDGDDGDDRLAAPSTAQAGSPAPAPGSAVGDRHARGEKPRKPRPRSRSNPRYLALLRIDVSALTRGEVHGGELCEISGIGPVPVSVARQLLGDAVVKLIVTKGVAVANVTHLGRGPTVAQRMALLWRSPSCSNEACARSFVQIDHREAWAETRHTVLQELDPLCPHCHRLKTYQGWSLVDGTGKRSFVPPTDPRHPHPGRRRPGSIAAA